MDSHNPTTMSQPYPDIVSKFFPMAPKSQFYNEWMLRTHFIETLHKALIDPDENNREAAKEFLDFSSIKLFRFLMNPDPRQYRGQPIL